MTTEEHLRVLEETDRRIQRKHEALAETVELIAAMHRDLVGKVDILTDRTLQAMDAINRLGNIMISHEERLDHLKGN